MSIATYMADLKIALSGLGVDVVDGSTSSALNTQYKRSFISIIETTVESTPLDSLEIVYLDWEIQIGIHIIKPPKEGVDEALARGREIYSDVLAACFGLTVSDFQVYNVRGERVSEDEIYISEYLVTVTLRTTEDYSQCV